MKIPIYVVDAFASRVFTGNPAAVCMLSEWPTESLMQNIAAENNLSETAFLIKDGTDYHIRWFTPTIEMDICGHATLASAHVIFNHLSYPGDTINFKSKSGVLKVLKGAKGLLTLNFPSYIPELAKDPPESLQKGLKYKQAKVYKGPLDYLVVLDKQEDIEALDPDFTSIAAAGLRGVVVTAKGNDSDFVSRCFFPQSGINEDPVTGSAHCMLVPYWAQETGKKKLTAQQLSKRRGFLECELVNDRVLMSGYAVTYMKGEIDV